MQQLSKTPSSANLRGRSPIIVQIWWIVQSTLFGMSPQFMYGWRRWLLRVFGAKIGKGVLIRPTARVTYPWKLVIGDYSWIGDQAELYNWADIRIGSNSVVSQRSYLCTGSHDMSKKNFPLNAKPILIADGVWVATDVFIAPGVSVEEGAVIGARSSVFSDIPERAVAYGYPAKIKSYREFE